MTKTPTPPAQDPLHRLEIYSGAARAFHWLTVAFLLVQVPLGLAMVYRGKVQNIWDGVTNTLYSSHKLIGVIILFVVVLRLAYRLAQGAPASEPTITGWQRVVSALNHWGMYVLLIVIPVLGYLGVSYYPALDIFGVFSLPGLVPPLEPEQATQAMAATVFRYHALAAFTLIGLVGLHVAAALYHYVIRGDNVLGRMVPALLRNHRD